MKKLLTAILLFSTLVSSAYAVDVTFKTGVNRKSPTLLSLMRNASGITFYKDFTAGSSTDADFSIGSASTIDVDQNIYSYAYSRNRTANEETIAMSFSLTSDVTTSPSRYLFSDNGKGRLAWTAAAPSIEVRPNTTDNGTVKAQTYTYPSGSASGYVFATGVKYDNNPGETITTYMNGKRDGAMKTTNFTANAETATKFYIGSANAKATPLLGTPKRFVVYNTKLSDEQVYNISATLGDYRTNVFAAFGDSITVGLNDSVGLAMGWRDHIQDLLGIRNYLFVGSTSTPTSDTTYYVQHSGASGERADQIKTRFDSQISGVFGGNYSSNSIFHLLSGTNDARQATTDGQIDTAVTNDIAMITTMLTTYPLVNVVVGLLPPNNEDGLSGTNETYVLQLNTKLKAQLDTLRLTYSKLSYVDYHALIMDNYPTITDCLSDNTHPNDACYTTMATGLYDCLQTPTHQYCNGN